MNNSIIVDYCSFWEEGRRESKATLDLITGNVVPHKCCVEYLYDEDDDGLLEHCVNQILTYAGQSFDVTSHIDHTRMTNYKISYNDLYSIIELL